MGGFLFIGYGLALLQSYIVIHSFNRGGVYFITFYIYYLVTQYYSTCYDVVSGKQGATRNK